jgi:hypothetical protein
MDTKNERVLIEKRTERIEKDLAVAQLDALRNRLDRGQLAV